MRTVARQTSRKDVTQTVSCKAYSDFGTRQTVDLEFDAFGMIGQGTFGKIHIVKNVKVDGKDEGQPETVYALKIVHQDPAYCNRELDILELLRGSANILNLNYAYFTRYDSQIFLNLLTEYLPGGTLYSKIYTQRCTSRTRTRSVSRNQQRNFIIPEKSVRLWTRDILKGLAFMHEKAVAHRDLKPENLAFDQANCLKIIDLGSAKLVDRKVSNSTDICTLLYRAPELLLNNKIYDVTIDIWAAACIVCEMIAGRPLFTSSDKNYQIEKIVECLGHPPVSVTLDTPPAQLKKLLAIKNESAEVGLRKRLLQLDPNDEHHVLLLSLLTKLLSYENRWSAKVALQHRYFS